MTVFTDFIIKGSISLMQLYVTPTLKENVLSSIDSKMQQLFNSKKLNSLNMNNFQTRKEIKTKYVF